MEKINKYTFKCLDPVDPEIAVKETNSWRIYYAYEGYIVENCANPPTYPSIEKDRQFQQLKHDAFRGFKIPLSSMEELMKFIEKYNEDSSVEKIGAVRAYIARTEEDPTNDSADLHAFLVPVVGGNNSDPGHDLLLEDGKSCIFNFSTPCPKQCDVQSSLYELFKQPNVNG